MASARTIKVTLVQMEVLPGRPAENTRRILDYVRAARAENAEIVVFPEMAVPGYLIGDDWEHQAFLRECEACGEEIRKASEGITAIFGNVGLDWTKRNEDGRVRKYNALFVAYDGKFLAAGNAGYPFVIKTLLPNYREFDDSRYFCDLRKVALEQGKKPEDIIEPVRSGRLALGCLLCEDIWDENYAISPLRILAEKNADLLVCISCSPFTVDKKLRREKVLAAHAVKVRRPILYVNNVGIQNNGKTIFAFDGSTCIFDGCGNKVPGPTDFEEGILTFDVPLESGLNFGERACAAPDDIGRIYRAISYGTRRFMDSCGVKRVVVGVSGGIDSSVVAAIYRRLLEPENLLLISMPGRYTSALTRRNAVALAEKLGCYYAEISIENSVKLTASQVDGLVIRSREGGLSRKLALTDFMLENVQARDRSSRILAAVAVAFGGVFTCNANKAEATVGYTTFYGDLAGYMANIADLWKGEVYELGRYLNEQVFGAEVIPGSCMEIAPSAELSSAQNIEEGKGDPLIYPYHDLLFKSWVEWWDRATPEEILEWYMEGALEKRLGYEGKIGDLFRSGGAFVADLERWWGQYQGLAVAKRIQAPPVFAVKRRAFGFDHRESQMGARYTQRYVDLKKKLLKNSNQRK